MTDAQAVGVGRGDLEAVEDDFGEALVDQAKREDVDDLGDGELDRFMVFQGQELDPGAEGLGSVVSAEFAEAGVGAFQAGVKVAEQVIFEGDGSALESANLDVATEFGLHRSLLSCEYPRGGWFVNILDAYIWRNCAVNISIQASYGYI